MYVRNVRKSLEILIDKIEKLKNSEQRDEFIEFTMIYICL